MCAGQKYFQKSIGGAEHDVINAASGSYDKGVFVGGYTKSAGIGQEDFLLLKLDSMGDVQAMHTYGGVFLDVATSLVGTADDGCLLAGYTKSFGTGPSDFLVVKTGVGGLVEWSWAMGRASVDEANTIIQTRDSGFVVAGKSFNGSSYEFLTVRLDQAGAVTWANSYGGMGKEIAYALAETSVGDLLVLGETSSFGAGDSDILLAKLTAGGDTIWSKTYGGVEADIGRALIVLADSTYLLAGSTVSFDSHASRHGSASAWLLNVDQNGSVIWSKTYGLLGAFSEFRSVEQSSTGDIYAGGKSDVSSNDLFLVKTNSSGTKLWSRNVGGVGVETCTGIVETDHNQFVAAGFSSSFSGGLNNSALVFNFDSTGRLLCNESLGPSTSNDTLPLVSSPVLNLVAGVIVSPASVSGAAALLPDSTLCSLDCDAIAEIQFVPEEANCIGDTVAFFNGMDGGTSYQWFLDAIPYSSGEDTSYVVLDTNEILVSLLVAHELCYSPDSAAAVLSITDNIVANFTHLSNQLFATFTNLSLHAADYHWDFGDGDTSSVANPTHEYTAPGIYNVCLAAANNCRDSLHCEEINVVDNNAGRVNSHRSVEIFPVPADQLFNLKVEPAIRKEKLSCRLLDTSGKIVLDRAISNDMSSIPISGMSMGLYFIQLVDRASGNLLWHSKLPIVH